MTEGAPALFVALEQSGFAASIRQSTWLYPMWRLLQGAGEDPEVATE